MVCGVCAPLTFHSLPLGAGPPYRRGPPSRSAGRAPPPPPPLWLPSMMAVASRRPTATANLCNAPQREHASGLCASRPPPPPPPSPPLPTRVWAQSTPQCEEVEPLRGPSTTPSVGGGGVGPRDTVRICRYGSPRTTRLPGPVSRTPPFCGLVLHTHAAQRDAQSLLLDWCPCASSP